MAPSNCTLKFSCIINTLAITNLYFQNLYAIFPGDEQFESVEDHSIVTLRSKYYVGSSGSVWASDYVMLKAKRPDLYEVNEPSKYSYPNVVLRQMFSLLHDGLFYFFLTNVDGDTELLFESTKHTEYHKLRLKTLEHCAIEAIEYGILGFDKLSEDEKLVLVDFRKDVETLRHQVLQISELIVKKK